MNKAFAHLRFAVNLGESSGLLHRSGDLDKIIELAQTNRRFAYADFVKWFRRSAWRNVLDKTQFKRWLDAQQRKEMNAQAEADTHIPFTAANIESTFQTILASRGKLFRQSAFNVFKALTDAAPENSVWGEAWKSNSDIQVNKRIVLPHFVSWCKIMNSFSIVYGRRDLELAEDLDRVLCILVGEDFDTCRTISKAFQADVQYKRPAPQEFNSRFFRVRIYKKGTCHLYWKDADLRVRFNQVASEGRRELSAGR